MTVIRMFDKLLAIEVFLELLESIDYGEALAFDDGVVSFTLQQFLAGVCNKESAMVILLT